MLTKSLLPIFIFINSVVYSQQNFQYSPKHPKAGDVITFTYTPSGDIANTQKPVEGVVYTLGNYTLGRNDQTAEDIELKLVENKYTGTFKTDTTQNFVWFGFSADKKFDNNFGNGYWIQLYDGDKIKKGSNISALQFYQYAGRSVNVDQDNKRALQYFDQEVSLYPESKKENLYPYLRMYTSLNNEQATAVILKEIEGILKSSLKEELDYILVSNLYSLAKLPEQSKFFMALSKEKFPSGRMAIGEKIQNFNKEPDLAKKEMMLNEISQKISLDPNWKYLQTSLSNYQSQFLYTYINNKDWSGFKKALERIHLSQKIELAGLYNDAAWEMQKTSDNLKLAEEFSARSLAIAKAEWQNPSEKPQWSTQKQWKVARESNYGMYEDTYAMVLYRLGEYKKAMPYTKDAIRISNGLNTDENNTYALISEKTQSAKKYIKELEQFVKAGKATSDIKEILKRGYLKSHKSEEGFDDYITVLEKETYLNMIAKLRNTMMDEAVPSFALYDLNKNKIDISELKNKIVVVDFWATWCGPCKASFPTMQKMVTKYKDNLDVKFVFVDTWEKGEDKQKDASDFITANKYTFHVLQDIDNKVVEQFKVNGIPTKFIIDKNGMIRFKSVGWDGSEKLMNELTAMIELAKDPKKTF